MRVVEPSALIEYFQALVGTYRPDESGELLIYWFRNDRGLFEHQRMDDPRAKELLSEILDDGEIVRQRFSPIPTSDGDRLVEWQDLRDELIYRNRYFPGVDIDLERLEQLLSHLKIDEAEVPGGWYRARIQTGDAAFDISYMGAPPKRTASHGRANPAGIPYLYLASSIDTAISEVRPHTGEIVCVADFSIVGGLSLVDLRRPKKTVSPFLFADARDIGRMRNDLPFLERLGEELTRPVVPQSAAIDYTPSQYLCEFIKKCGYDGVVYRSSVSGGMNLALFSVEIARAGAVAQFRVDQVSVRSSVFDG